MIGFLEVTNSSSYSSRIWRIKKKWPVVYLLRWNQYLWSTILPSMYGPKLEWIFDKMLYEIDSSGIPR
jgi:hypothetical protein